VETWVKDYMYINCKAASERRKENMHDCKSKQELLVVIYYM